MLKMDEGQEAQGLDNSAEGNVDLRDLVRALRAELEQQARVQQELQNHIHRLSSENAVLPFALGRMRRDGRLILQLANQNDELAKKQEEAAAMASFRAFDRPLPFGSFPPASVCFMSSSGSK